VSAPKDLGKLLANNVLTLLAVLVGMALVRHLTAAPT